MKHLYFYRLLIYLAGIAIIAALYLYWLNARNFMDIIFCAIGEFVNEGSNYVGHALNIESLKNAWNCVKSGQIAVIAVAVVLVWASVIKKQEG